MHGIAFRHAPELGVHFANRGHRRRRPDFIGHDLVI